MSNKQVYVNAAFRAGLQKHQQHVQSLHLDAFADRLANGNHALAAHIRSSIEERPDGTIAPSDQQFSDVNALVAALCTALNIALPAAPVTLTQEERNAKAQAAARALREDELSFWRNKRIDILEGVNKDASLATVEKLIADLEHELHPAERAKVLSPEERKRLQIEMTANTSTGMTQAHAAARLAINNTTAAPTANPFKSATLNVTVGAHLDRDNPGLAAQLRAAAGDDIHPLFRRAA
jgi:hypothetical protein